MEFRLQHELNTILRQEELMWYQRSRAKWLTDGDRNTKYYHLKTVNRRRRNNIVMLKDGHGQWVDDVKQLQKLANDFYRNLFTNNHLSRDWHQTYISYPLLDAVTQDKLSAPLLDDEGCFLHATLEGSWSRWFPGGILSKVMGYSGTIGV
jgi:hypothetical protein